WSQHVRGWCSDGWCGIGRRCTSRCGFGRCFIFDRVENRRFTRLVMSLNGKAYIVGAYEHPTRQADDLSVARLHADVARGALEDAGLRKNDTDGYFCAGDAPGLGATSMVEYLGLRVRHVDSTECGGSAPILHVSHAAQAIAAGRCNIALITLAGRPRAAGAA